MDEELNKREHESDLGQFEEIALAELRKKDPDIELLYALESHMEEHSTCVVTLSVWKPNVQGDSMDYEDGWIEIVSIHYLGNLSNAHLNVCVLNNHQSRSEPFKIKIKDD